MHQRNNIARWRFEVEAQNYPLPRLLQLLRRIYVLLEKKGNRGDDGGQTATTSAEPSPLLREITT